MEKSPENQENDCFYAIYRLDTKNSLGHDFILYTYINDSAPVRSKMIYASTLSALKVRVLSVKSRKILEIFLMNFLRRNSAAGT